MTFTLVIPDVSLLGHEWQELAGSRGSQCSRNETMDKLRISAKGCIAAPAPKSSRRAGGDGREFPPQRTPSLRIIITYGARHPRAFAIDQPVIVRAHVPQILIVLSGRSGE